MTRPVNKPPRLAKGLSALLGDLGEAYDQTDTAPPARLPIEFLRPNRHQPRRNFDEALIRSLADSIREKGIIQPLLVREDPEVSGSYEIVAGERRWRAAQLAQLHDVPVVVRSLSDSDALEVALVENIQRRDLLPLEEAEGYRRLMEDYGHTQEELAQTVGRSRSHVANTLRLMSLPDEVKTMLDENILTAGHARAVLAAPEPVAVAREIAAKGLNVRQAECLARRAQRGDQGTETPALSQRDANTRELERRLSDRLGLTVRIRHRRNGGELRIRYTDVEHLDEILRRLGGND